MASKTDLQHLEKSILNHTKVQISEAVDPLKSDLCDVRTRLDETDVRVTKLEELFQKEGGPNKNTESSENHETVAVFGGLASMSLENAQKRLSDQLWNSWLPQPTEIYSKGQYNGILIAKFNAKTDRDNVVG